MKSKPIYMGGEPTMPPCDTTNPNWFQEYTRIIGYALCNDLFAFNLIIEIGGRK